MLPARVMCSKDLSMSVHARGRWRKHSRFLHEVTRAGPGESRPPLPVTASNVSTFYLPAAMALEAKASSLLTRVRRLGGSGYFVPKEL